MCAIPPPPMGTVVGIKWVDFAPNDYSVSNIQELIGVYTASLQYMVYSDFIRYTYDDIEILDGYMSVTLYMEFNQVTVRVYGVQVSADELKSILNRADGYTNLILRLSTGRVSEIIAAMDHEVIDMMPDGAVFP